ncbi:MAG: hypothetical protein KC549_08215 [Myxococcales bacterium]|nr:hypothetical protein [Myxococcales bacterium]
MGAWRCPLLAIPVTLLGVFAIVLVSVFIGLKLRSRIGLAEDMSAEEVHESRDLGAATLVVGDFSDYVTTEPRPGQRQESLERFTFVEARSRVPGPPMRAFDIRCPGRRALVQALDGRHLVIGDDRVRLELRGLGDDVERAKRRALLVHAALRLDDAAFVAEVGLLAHGRERLPILEAVLPAFAGVPAFSGLAALVRETDPPHLRAAAALLAGNRDAALELGREAEVPSAFILTLFGPTPAHVDPRHDELWARVLTAEELPTVRAGLERLRALPDDRQTAALGAALTAGVARDALEAVLRRSVQLDPQAAAPHLQATVASLHAPPAARLLAAGLLHEHDPDAAEAVLLAAVEVADEEEAVVLLGGLARFGGPAAMLPLRTWADGRGPVATAAQAAMDEIRGRLAHLPTGGLALLRESAADGGLSQAAAQEPET